jgi:hypothetical protein
MIIRFLGRINVNDEVQFDPEWAAERGIKEPE